MNVNEARPNPPVILTGAASADRREAAVAAGGKW